MSYYFCIVGTKDNPLFEHEFGTSKQGGDGVARFREEARHLNQFIVHSSLDIVEEVMWNSGAMYLKVIDKFYNNYISCFLTGGNIKFLLLHAPLVPPSGNAGTSKAFVASNPTAPATEEAIRQFFNDIYDVWVKNIMNPFYSLNGVVSSPIFRARVAQAGKKYL
ncbi:MAG: TRAPP subunit [Trizodia sp. TS-e1964]|nr:MAG: TRAPP subunit [Trizodia sp. TS-e1964]